jgi:hypothetical protein
MFELVRSGEALRKINTWRKQIRIRKKKRELKTKQPTKEPR